MVIEGLLFTVTPTARGSRAQDSEKTSVEPKFDSNSLEASMEETFAEIAWTSESNDPSVVAWPDE